MAEQQAIPALQNIDLSVTTSGKLPIHRALYQKRERRSRGAMHDVQGLGGTGMSLPATASGLSALVTPTLATFSGGTVLTHVGTAASGGPRLVIPLPAALATATAMTGSTVPTPAAGAKGTVTDPNAPLPSIALDSEWFFLQAYPEVMRTYLATSYSFERVPTNPGEYISKTDVFLRRAYTKLGIVGLEFPLAAGLKDMFNELVSLNPTGGIPKHPYGESEVINNMYMILAYVMSTLLWSNGASKPLRNYTEVTYPGVIMAAYVQRMTYYYVDLSRAMKLTTPYLRRGGRGQATNLATLKKEEDIQQTTSAFLDIPLIASNLRLAAEYATGKRALTGDCDTASYGALQDAALNVPGLTPDVVKEDIMLKKPADSEPAAQKITNARCSYYLGLVTRKINPADTSAAVPGGTPGSAPLV